MTLTYAGKRLLKVYVDHPDVKRWTKLWKLIDRIEELDFSYGTHHISPFLSSLGPAPNLKVLRLRDVGPNDRRRGQQRRLPKIFKGCLPSLRELSLTIAVAMSWPTGLFKDLRSFDLGVDADDPICSTLVLDVLRESPLLENLRLVGSCELPHDEPSPVVLSSLKTCTLIGNEALSLISLICYMDIPPSTNVFLSTPPLLGDAAVVYPFHDLCLAPGLHVLDGVSTASFTIGFDTIKLRVQNESGGILDIQVYYYENVMIGLMIIAVLLKDLFCGSTSKFQSMKVFSLHIGRNAGRDDAESVFCATVFAKFIFSTPSLERITLCGIPARALSFYLLFLQKGLDATIPFPNLQQVHIETTPIRSAKLLLGNLDMLIKKRNESGIPLQFVGVKVNCETLVPMVEHSAFLTAWKDLVGGDVKVEYFRDRVEELPRRGLPFVRFTNPPESEDEGGGGEADAVESGDYDSEWESWNSGKWPKAASEMRGATET